MIYKLGVVVAIYNTAQFLEQCVESIVGQTLSDIKIALVDDGSTDISGEICNHYASRYENVTVIHQKNRGKLFARYQGVRVLEDCEYITFVDSDDWLDVNIYERLRPYMLQDIDVIEYGIISCSSSAGRKNLWAFNNMPKFYARDDIETEILPQLIFNNEKKEFGVRPSLCSKVIKYNLAENFLKLASEKLVVGYGDDIAVSFPLMQKISSYIVVEEYGYFYRHQDNYVPAYLTDPLFFHKLIDLYDFLMDHLDKSERYRQQMDFFFAYAVDFRMSKCYKRVTSINYLFPFHLVPKGKKVIIYGAGNVGRAYYEQLLSISYCESLIWIDKYIKNEKIIEMQDALNKEFDVIVIAIKSEETIINVKDELINKYKVSEKKIVWGLEI